MVACVYVACSGTEGASWTSCERGPERYSQAGSGGDSLQLSVW